MFHVYIFVSKYPNICNIHYSQKELKHSGLEILVVYYLNFFELYQVFMR